MDHTAYDLVPSDSHIKFRLDSLSPGKLLLVYTTAVALVLACVCGGVFAPHAFGRLKGTVYRCEDGENYSGRDGGEGECFPYSTEFVPKWVGTLDDISPMNQFFVIYVDVYRDESLLASSALSIDVELLLEVSLFGLRETEAMTQLMETVPKSYQIRCTSQSSLCGSLFLGYQAYLEYPAYTISLKVSNWGKAGKWLEKIEVNVRAVREEFSDYQLAVKYSFGLMSFVSMLCYMYQVLRTRVGEWSTETRGLIVLSLSTVIFNDPTFLLSLTHPHFALTAVSVLSVVQFISVLAYFWVSILLEIRPLSSPSTIRYWLSVYVWCVAVLLSFLCLYVAMVVKDDPSYQLTDCPLGFKLLAVVAFALTAGYFLFLGWLTVRTIPVLPRQTKRLRFICWINVTLAGTTVVAIAAGCFQRLPSWGGYLLVVEGTYNVYVGVMQVVMAPVGGKETGEHLEMTGVCKGGEGAEGGEEGREGEWGKDSSP